MGSSTRAHHQRTPVPLSLQVVKEARRAATLARAAAVLGSDPGRVGEGVRLRQGGQDGDRVGHEGAGAQRAVPLWVGQEVQVLPRCGALAGRKPAIRLLTWANTVC